MYIRKSMRSYKGRTYTNYVLVESVQTPNGPRQKSVYSLGDLSPRPREEWLRLTRKVEDALLGQERLVDQGDAEVAAIVRQVRERRENTPPLPAGSAEVAGAKTTESRIFRDRLRYHEHRRKHPNSQLPRHQRAIRQRLERRRQEARLETKNRRR